MTLGHGVRSSCRSQRDLLCSDTAHWPSLAKRQDAACRCVLEERMSPDAREPADWTMWRSHSCDSCGCKSSQAGLCRISFAEEDPRRGPYFDSIALSCGAVFVLIGGHNCYFARKSPSGDIQSGSGDHPHGEHDNPPFVPSMVTLTTRLVVNWPACQNRD